MHVCVPVRLSVRRASPDKHTLVPSHKQLCCTVPPLPLPTGPCRGQQSLASEAGRGWKEEGAVFTAWAWAPGCRKWEEGGEGWGPRQRAGLVGQGGAVTEWDMARVPLCPAEGAEPRTQATVVQRGSGRPAGVTAGWAGASEL